jgi:hypothetical protein
MEPTMHAEHILSLHDLVTGTSDIRTIMEGVTRFAAKAMTEAAGAPIDCAVTLRRRKRTATVAGSSDRAVELDRIEQSLGQGPCLEALDRGCPVVLKDVATDVSWPQYSKALASAGCHSALGVPMDLGETSEAVLNFFAPAPGLFTERVIDEAAAFADVAGSTLRLAIRIESVERLNEDLKAAMASRTVINLASGVIMAQNQCSPEEAFRYLLAASSHRNEKIHAVAESIVSRFSGTSIPNLQFDD